MAVIEQLRQPRPGSNWDWQLSAACRGMDSAAFFPVNGEGVSRQARIKAAKSICNSCPVARICLDHALEAREPYGVWGGRSEDERARMLGVETLMYPAPRRIRVSRSRADL
ncbi:MAG TPA: WhiB family transcriptional regulator [Micropruina sp.]|nr:WhiB family transcriptional regulator [Micropruina sp.]